MRDSIAISKPTVAAHFVGRPAELHEIYRAILLASSKFGSFREDPKKSSIHLVNRTAYAGVQTQKAALVLTLKSKVDIPSKRAIRSEKVSANRWYVEFKLTSLTQVDSELLDWLKASYQIAE
jgi:hypothetical protein